MGKSIDFFTALKRHNIYRVAAAYAVVAWVLLQLVANVAPILDLPPWVARAMLLLLGIGFPVAVVLAWAQEIGTANGADARSRAVTSRLDWVLAGALLVVIALVSYQQFGPTRAARTAQNTQAGIAAARAASDLEANAISIAVLPFNNLSSDTEQEFFSDGMTEEITAALAKIPDLRVVARTSAFQFKGEKKDMRAVGQALGVTHLIEGSVRKAGMHVRITAQLIEANSGVHVWAENYDRELTDVFAVQEDIATAIAGALRMPLGLKQGERLVSNRTGDVDSYQEYLRAKALVRVRGRPGLADATVLLQQVVAREPNFAPAWALLARAYDLAPTYHPARASGSVEEFRHVVDEFLPKAEAAARRAIQLDPNLPDGQLALAHVLQDRGKFLEAEELYLRALALDPSNPDALSTYSLLLASVGRLKEALAMRLKVQSEEQLAKNLNANTALLQWLNGQSDIAIATLDKLPYGDDSRGLYLPRIYAAAGAYREAADVLKELSPRIHLPGADQEAARLLSNAPAKTASPQNLPPLGNLGFAYIYVGAPERVLEFYEGALESGYSVNVAIAFLWHPSYAPVRRTERFRVYVRRAGLVEYWRAKGWPQFCHPTTADDFTCS